jgi:hypothetical protein
MLAWRAQQPDLFIGKAKNQAGLDSYPTAPAPPKQAVHQSGASPGKVRFDPRFTDPDSKMASPLMAEVPESRFMICNPFWVSYGHIPAF